MTPSNNTSLNTAPSNAKPAPSPILTLNSLITAAAVGRRVTTIALFREIRALLVPIVRAIIANFRRSGSRDFIEHIKLAATCLVRLVELRLTLRFHPERFTRARLLGLRQAAALLETIYGAALDFSPLEKLAQKMEKENAKRTTPAKPRKPSKTTRSTWFARSARSKKTPPSSPQSPAAPRYLSVHEIPEIPFIPGFKPAMFPLYSIPSLYPFDGPIPCYALPEPSQTLLEVCQAVAFLMNQLPSSQAASINGNLGPHVASRAPLTPAPRNPAESPHTAFQIPQSPTPQPT